MVHGDKMKLNGPIDDIQLRAWGIQLVDGRMPGFCAVVGCAKSNEVAVKIVRELQSRGILIFLSGNVNGRSIIHQLQEEGIQLGYDTFTVPFGLDTISAVYALGFAARSALTFGGMDAGQARDIMLYNKYRVFAFVLALGEVDDLKYATAAGAISYGFPVIADTRIPQILPTGVTTYEHVVSMPFDEIPGADDMERTEKLIQRCIEVRGVKVKIAKVPIPVSYGSAFEGERIRKDIMYAEFGGKRSHAFEFLRMKPADEVEDGKITVHGTDLDGMNEGDALPLGMIVDVSGRKMQTDFEPILERQFHYFINGVEGIQHNGQRDIAWTRVSKNTFAKGFRLEHFGKVIHARIHEVFGNIVDKVQVTLTTDAAEVDERIEEARAGLRRAQRAHRQPHRRVGRHLLLVPALPELRAQPRLRGQPRTRRSLRGLQLAGLQGLLRDQPHRPQPAGAQGHRPRPGQRRVLGPQRVHPRALQPDRRQGDLLLHHGVADDLVRLLRVHHGARARGQRLHDRQPGGPQHDALRHDLQHPGRHRGRRHADAGHDGHGQVLPHEQEVHPRRRRHEARRLDELQPQGEHASRPRGSLRSARASPTCSTRSPTRPWPPPWRSCCPSSRQRGTPR